MPGYRPDRGPLDGYLYGVLRRHHAKLRGRRRRHSATAESEGFARVADPLTVGERDADLRLDVAEAIARLDPGLARLADGLRLYSLAELAREWQVPRTTLQRRVEKLRLAFDHLKNAGGS